MGVGVGVYIKIVEIFGVHCFYDTFNNFRGEKGIFGEVFPNWLTNSPLLPALIREVTNRVFGKNLSPSLPPLMK